MNLMLLHPVFFLFMIFLFFSIFLTVSCSSWFIAWIALEMNMLSFIPLILKKKNKYSSESALKYFLIQTIASVVIILSIVMLPNMNSDFMTSFLLLSLITKVGSAPLHQWVPSLVEGMTWQILIVFFTLQKANPLILLSVNPNMVSYSKIIFMSILFSAILGPIGGLNQVSIRKIMVYSSIAHISWLFSGIYISSITWFFYYLIYSIVLFCVLNIFNSKEVYSLNQLLLYTKTYFISTIICFFSLGGMPPFTGFTPKFITSMELLKENLFFVFFFLLTSTFLSMFFYMRMIINNTLLTNSKMTVFYFNSMKSSFYIYLNLIILLTPLLFYLL